MSGFIRPQARAALWRWREVIIGAALVFVGAYLGFGQGGLAGYLGIAIALTGAAIVFLGRQRSRLRGWDGGVGSVDVDEGQVIYFGPLTGGAMALREVRELALLRTGVTAHWRLTGADAPLYIPVDAAGSDELFDAFTALPGLNVERLLAVRAEKMPHDTVIWRRSNLHSLHDRLH